MERNRPYVMSLAGLDPSGGAGLLADIKTFEAQRAYGLGVCTALTVQTDTRFLSVQWQTAAQALAQAGPLLQRFPVRYCKIGIVQDVHTLLQLVRGLRAIAPQLRIVLDPVLKASAGFVFHDRLPESAWSQVLQQLYLLTPNYDEALLLSGQSEGGAAAAALSSHCHVLLKGGHRPEQPGLDMLYRKGLPPCPLQPGEAGIYAKHGSGCVLSAAVTAQLALGRSLPEACANGKAYTEAFLRSHPSLLGYHSL